MEFNARYVLNGLFAVAVVVAVFAFVYWLKNAGGFGERESYQVRFTVPVSGLSRGADVLFNGVKVGQVDGIYLDAGHPDHLVASIAIAKGTPLHEDTVAGIDYAGLTGAASILLTGGTAAAPRLAPNDTILADPGASRSWTQNAGRLLGKLADLVDKNSGRFDDILAGLARLAGGSSDKPPPITHDLIAADQFASPAEAAAWQLTVSEPSVVLSLNTDRILGRPGEAETQPIGELRWSDSLPNLVQTRIIQSFENAGYTNVLRPVDASDADYNLLLDIRRFWIAGTDPGTATIDIMARIMDRDGAAVAVRQFQMQLAASGTDEEAQITAMQKAFQSVESELVDWAAANAQ